MPSEWQVFEERPDRDAAPDACQYEAFDAIPTHYVLYRSPKEYVCYCQSHAVQQKQAAAGKIIKRL